MRIRYETEDKVIVDTAIPGTVRIDTGKGSITINAFTDVHGGFQAISIEGDKATTWLKFDGENLL